MTKTVLITGFDPFNRETVNPAWEAVRQLDGWRGDGFVVAARQLPTVFGRANEVLAAAIAELRPQLVIAVGQAGGRSEITIERVAINVDDASIADNAQQQPVDRSIAAAGPAAYFSTLPIKAIVRELRARGLPASVSQTAGTFVCNHVFYGLMHYLATQAPAHNTAPGAQVAGVKAGFIHIPYLPQQAAAHPGAPSMALADLVTGLRGAIEVSLAQAHDIAETGGSTH